MKRLTRECCNCDVYDDRKILEADNAGLIPTHTKLEIIEDYIKVNQGKMSQMAFCKKHNINYVKFSKIAYVLEAGLVTENEQLKKAFQKYGWHRQFCRMFNSQPLAKKEDCNCGYFEALKEE